MNRILAYTGLSVALVLIGFSFSFAEPNAGEDPMNHSFQVTIRVFAEGDGSPVAEHLILFDQGTIYSLPTNKNEPVTVVNTAEDRVMLLDRNTGVHSAISTTDLVSMTAKLRSSASSDALKERLGINAEVQADALGNYSVAYGQIQYATTTQKPLDPELAIQFGRFADWASRLNIAQQRGLPPFGRMLMNSRIASDGRIPLETNLYFQQSEATQHYRSTHEVRTALSHSGRLQINQVINMLALSKAVPLREFPQ